MRVCREGPQARTLTCTGSTRRWTLSVWVRIVCEGSRTNLEHTHRSAWKGDSCTQTHTYTSQTDTHTHTHTTHTHAHTVLQLPGKGAPIGHNRDSAMVPFFPRHFHHWYFVDSRTLGYTFDNFGFGKSNRKMRVQPESGKSNSCLRHAKTLGSLSICSTCILRIVHWPEAST